MDKIKIGLVGADTFEDGKTLISFFDNAELVSVFETNKFKLSKVISSAIESGLYVKSFNNSDDFYQTKPDIVLVGKTMHEYICTKNSFVISGFCEEEYAEDGIAAEKDGKLYFRRNGKWVCFDSFEFSSSEQLAYIKSGKKPLIAFFMLKQRYGE